MCVTKEWPEDCHEIVLYCLFVNFFKTPAMSEELSVACYGHIFLVAVPLIRTLLRCIARVRERNGISLVCVGVLCACVQKISCYSLSLALISILGLNLTAMTTVLVLHYCIISQLLLFNEPLVALNTNFQVSTCNALILVFLTLECVIRTQVLLADHSNGGCAQCVWLRATH